MSEHHVFKTPLRPIVMMVIGFYYVIQDVLPAILLGVSVYAAIVWIEHRFDI